MSKYKVSGGDFDGEVFFEYSVISKEDLQIKASQEFFKVFWDADRDIKLKIKPIGKQRNLFM